MPKDKKVRLDKNPSSAGMVPVKEFPTPFSSSISPFPRFKCSEIILSCKVIDGVNNSLAIVLVYSLIYLRNFDN